MDKPEAPPPEVKDNSSEHRYEAHVDGRVAAVAEYRLQGDTITFTHTEVEPEFEGRGLGSRLARGALDDVRRRGLQAVAQCEFIAGYLGKHPEYQDVLGSKG